MSERPLPRKRPGPPLIFRSSDNDPTELGRLQKTVGQGLGNSYVVQLALDELEDPRHREKRDLVGIICGLMQHLSPTQALPTRLPDDAVVKLGDILKDLLAHKEPKP